MGQAGRSEPHLRVAEALADLAEHAIRRDTHVVERDLGVAAGRIGVDGVQHAVDTKARRIHVDEEHRRAEVVAARIERARHHDVDGWRRARR